MLGDFRNNIFGKFVCRADLEDIVFLYITRWSNTEYIYGKSVSAELTGGFVSLYITRWSNIELERMKILTIDIDYFDPKIFIFD